MLRARLQARVEKLLKHDAVTSMMSKAEIGELEIALPSLTLLELLVLIGEILAMIIDWLRNR